jgi:nucleoside-diphosphate-sugar epimerase
MPEIAWLRRDLSAMQAASDWTLLTDFDVVANCAGALQDSGRDDVAAVQHGAMLALFEAAATARLTLIVQISARIDGPASTLNFLASKRHADEALARSGIPFVIVRPAVVIGRNAHGGSALLRGLAAMPWRTPLVHAAAPMQFAALGDVTEAVRDAVEGRISPGSDFALATAETLRLREAVALHRAWLGLPPAKAIEIPDLAARVVAFVADVLGRLGWRSPLRSTAMEVAASGVTDSSATGHTPSGRQLKTLRETLADHPAGVQDLWFARLYLLKPVVLGVLALFWLVSGLVALIRFEQSAAHLVEAVGSRPVALAVTLATSLADILLGMAVLVRRFAAPALIGMVALSLGYLAAATLLAPELWADPLGPLVKVVPSIVLALAALAILDER